MKVPQIYSKHASDYEEGWNFAQASWEDLEPYDPEFWDTREVSDMRKEAYNQGYYDFWEKKNFE